jgi:hypothetical protein
MQQRSMVSVRVGVSARWTLRFHASMVGKVSGSGRAFEETCEPGFGSRPLEGTVVGSAAAGPTASVNAAAVVVGWLICWLAKTGRFWVTVWPKMEPKTPVSKLRP